MPFYLTFRNRFVFFGVTRVLTFSNVLPNLDPKNIRFSQVKANVRIVGCAIHHFPSDKDDPRLSVGRFLVAVFGDKKCIFRGEMCFFWSIHPPTKNLKENGYLKRMGLKESTKIHFECVYLEYEQKPFRAERTWKILRRCQAPIYPHDLSSLSTCSY